MASPKVGDLVEIKIAKGFAYALFTHQHPQFGALLRVLVGQHKKRPPELVPLIAEPVQFSTFFPLNAAVARELVTIVANVGVPEKLSAFPIFRDGVEDPKSGKVETWWLWDGKKEWCVGPLTSDQSKMPIRQIVNDTMLQTMIEQGRTD
ncbi:MAG TPA: hypothetical protein VGH02_06565 [Rhizomicrobium sp.]|jgi:hypothetical protein